MKEINEISLRIVDLIDRAEKVRDAVTDPLLITIDPFLAEVYLITAKIFGVPALLTKVDFIINKLGKLQEMLRETKEHQTAKRLELIVIWLIAVEVIPTLLKWFLGIMGLMLGESWIVETFGNFVDNLVNIFVH